MKPTIVLVLRSGGDFDLPDVNLIAFHIKINWKAEIKPRIICLYDKVTDTYDLGNFILEPLTNRFRGTWSRMMLYSPEMDNYRPFLYIDLDTAIISSIENIFELVNPYEDKLIMLEDFWQKKELATGLVWFPKDSEKVKKVWKAWKPEMAVGFRMDYFLRRVISQDLFFQQLTNTIYSFKPTKGSYLTELPDNADLVCFHGKPRIPGALYVNWVKEYINKFTKGLNKNHE